MSQTLTPEQERRILTFATHYAKNHWEVSQAAAHLSIDELGESDLEDEDSYLVCLDMPGVGDIQRIVVVLNKDGSVEGDHTYTDDMGCHACEYGKVRKYL